MRRTPGNLDSALQTLREESPTPSAVEHAKAALRKPKRVVTLAPKLAGAAGVLAALAIFWPREVNATWQETIKRSANAPAVHRIEHGKTGTPVYEVWRDGSKRAMYIRDAKGNLVCEQRCDGKRR